MRVCPRSIAAVAVAAALAAAVAGVARADAAPTFTSRVPYAPLVGKLKAAGGDVARVLHPRSAAALSALDSGRRYKMAVTSDGWLAIAPLPADAPHNEYVHPILAGGAPVSTAGGITVEHAGHKIEKVTIDQDSKAYCPTLDSLAAAERALVALGVPAAAIARHDQPPGCRPAR